VHETDPAVAHGVYSESKVRAEEACLARASVIDIVILRMATMYSPDWLNNVRKRVRPVSGGFPVYFSLDPHGRRYSLCSRRNGAEAVLWAVDGRLDPGVYNVADDYVYSQAEIRRAIEHVDGRGLTIPVPMLGVRLITALSSLMPSARWRENARSRYWKFCRANVYSASKLKARGLLTKPDLLDMAPPR
jgi:nucleoside-diphosphate-sugar epimerase